MHDNNNDDVILHIIVIITVICTVLYNNFRCLIHSKPTPSSIPKQDTQGTGSTSTTGTKSSTTKIQSPSKSTTLGKDMVDQKKVDGGTKKANRFTRSLSSVRSKQSKKRSVSQLDTTTKTNLRLATAED